MEFFDEEQRARLLQFVTGSSRVPLQGFKALQGSQPAARRLAPHDWGEGLYLGYLAGLQPVLIHPSIRFSPCF